MFKHFILLKNPWWIGVHQVDFTMLQPTTQALLNIYLWNKIKNLGWFFGTLGKPLMIKV